MRLGNRALHCVFWLAFCVCIVGGSVRAFSQVISIDKRDSHLIDIDNEIQKQLQERFPDEDYSLGNKNWIMRNRTREQRQLYEMVAKKNLYLRATVKKYALVLVPFLFLWAMLAFVFSPIK